MNVVAITGCLTADPARKETAKGVVTTFRIGSDDSPRVWVDVESWGHLAGICAAHLARGRHVGVAGALAHVQWNGRDGERRERWFIRATKVTFLDRPRAAGGDGDPTVRQPA